MDKIAYQLRGNIDFIESINNFAEQLIEILPRHIETINIPPEKMRYTFDDKAAPVNSEAKNIVIETIKNKLGSLTDQISDSKLTALANHAKDYFWENSKNFCNNKTINPRSRIQEIATFLKYDNDPSIITQLAEAAVLEEIRKIFINTNSSNIGNYDKPTREAIKQYCNTMTKKLQGASPEIFKKSTEHLALDT